MRHGKQSSWGWLQADREWYIRRVPLLRLSQTGAELARNLIIHLIRRKLSVEAIGSSSGRLVKSSPATTELNSGQRARERKHLGKTGYTKTSRRRVRARGQRHPDNRDEVA
jgi:hypothetical protein